MSPQALLLSLLMVTAISVAQSVTFKIINNCPFKIWPGTLTVGNGSQLSSTGFELDFQKPYSLDIPTPWNGYIWARTICSTDKSGKFKCTTGDCGTGEIACNGAGATMPVTQVEVTLGGRDSYSISVVNGFNLPVLLSPQVAGCGSTTCATNINIVCPDDLAVKNSIGDILACKSACLAFNQPEYCCTGEYGSPDDCFPTDYSELFKTECQQACTYAFDKSCKSTCNGGHNYDITFCPN